MSFDFDAFIARLKSQLDVFDMAASIKSCTEFIRYLYGSDEKIPLDKAEKIMKILRRKRMFLQMQHIAYALIHTERCNYGIRKLYAQALIDSGNYFDAIEVLNAILEDTNATLKEDAAALEENIEAKGLIGRVYKQLYVNNPASVQSAGYIYLAIRAYHEVYDADKKRLWHGINTAALVERAKRDNVEIKNAPNSQAIAAELIETIKGLAKVEYWDLATAAEACLVLNKPTEGLGWMLQYVNDQDCDAFELSSTLRQLEEVWQLNLTTESGQLLLPILRSQLAKRKGGNLVLNGITVKRLGDIDGTLDQKYQKLAKQDQMGQDSRIALEKNFGNESFNSFRWLRKGNDRCLCVGRIGKDAGIGMGSGFLVQGDSLKASLGKSKYLLTNAHVISDNKQFNAIHPDDAVVTFEGLDPNVEFRNLKIVWSSPVGELDATLLLFSDDDQDLLTELTKTVIPFPISKNLPSKTEPPSQKIYIIGHPNGGSLQISLYDNLLLDYEKHLVHYRTPTAGGSSGSPVFNENWELIALHHAGSKETPCLNNKGGTYSANEGIWIQSIINHLKNEV